MTKETLNSDRINYLIWRYLLESDYRETAVRLQKEWNVQDPQQLPFAPHVTHHALVAVLNRGLLYNVQEREPEQSTGDVAANASGFFGPLMPASPAADEDFENVRKRQIDSDHIPILSGPPAKKQRLSNGFENGVEGATPMDVDDDQMQNGDENAYPSPEQVPSPVVVTNGPETGTQVDKVHELSTETTFLELSDDPSSTNKVLLQCEFNPRDPTILAAAGTDALARMWTLSRGITDTGSESPRKPIFASAHNLLDEDTLQSTTATGLSWSFDGSLLALSSEPQDGEGISKVQIYDKSAAVLAEYNSFEAPIVCLRWNPSNTLCLAISPQDECKSTMLTVMVVETLGALSYSLPNLVLEQLDAVWTSNEEFVICGGSILQAYSLATGVISPERMFSTRGNESFSQIAYDMRTGLLATASDSGTIDIWHLSGEIRSSFTAHQGIITSLVWQPRPTLLAVGEECLLASSGDDGAISIWNVLSGSWKPKCSMTMDSAVVALSFTPDGAFIAGGTNKNVFIWKVDDTHLPRATWTRGDESGWRTPQSQHSSTDEDQFSLCWDADGQKLAYGVNSRLAVIDFRR